VAPIIAYKRNRRNTRNNRPCRLGPELTRPGQRLGRNVERWLALREDITVVEAQLAELPCGARDSRVRGFAQLCRPTAQPCVPRAGA